MNQFLPSQPKRARMDTQNQQPPTNNNGKASASLSQESEQQIVQDTYALPAKSAATLIIVFISIILYILILYKVELLEYSRLKIESILNILNEIFRMPIDDPVFRNLANSTTILIEDLVKFNIPASDNVKDLRIISFYLSDVISSSSDPTNLSPSLYLKNLGDKTYDVGKYIGSIYVSGSFTLDELFNEFQDIQQNLSISSKDDPLLLIQKEETQYFYDKVYNLISRSKDPLLTQKNAQYFYSRLGQVLNLITRFHGKFVKIEKEIQDIQKLYRGYNNAQGFSNIINYINENESTYKQIYDMETVQQKLDIERRQMDQLMAIDHEVIRIKESLNLYKNNLNDFIERIINLINRKIITHEDSQMLSEVLNSVDKAKEIWKEMDVSENNRLFRIEN
ncbi:hypothetical protein RhiirA5_499726 [Rhizophagus irregularis]|uniref:Uncharacterized protein n=1 Tax=Rhizophagus irregularis TaxID=588596 RepID=A0A2N0PPM9_9GLOM|nr:hypothetical protein RhiirA5_499726 [Rhizophagus irregularis]